MRHSITYGMIMAALLLAAGCRGDEPATEGGGDVTVRITICGGSSGNASRANTDTTEPGDDALNENTITRMDLYVFSGSTDDATCTAHKWWGTDVAKSSGTYTQTTTDGVVTGTWEDTGLVYAKDELAGKTVYLVANDPQGGERSISTLGDLRGATIGDSSFDGSALQTTFVMDGMSENLTLGSTITEETDQQTASTVYTIPISIARAAAKIRLHIYRTYDAGVTTEDITTSADIYYWFANSATDAALVADGTDISESVDLVSVDEEVPADDILKQTVDGVVKTVFYSYPNNYYDADVDMKLTTPINVYRQTHVMIHVPYVVDGTVQMFWYKVPINYRLQDDNDDPTAAVDEDLYRVQRNHIYDITALVDRIGGTVETPVTVTLKYQATEWDDKGGDVTFE